MILTSGCSFTAVRWPDHKPWPSYLSEILNIEVKNIAHEGESNSYAWRNVIWALNEFDDIEGVVIGLTEWDRFEVPVGDYGFKKIIKHFETLNDSGLYDRTKIYKIKAILKAKNDELTGSWHDKVDDDNFYDTYLDSYNWYFYMDCLATYLLSISEICKSRNIPFIGIQLLEPFHSGKINPELNKYINKFLGPDSEHYLENISPIKYVNRNIVYGMPLTADYILYNKREGAYWNLFTKKSPHLEYQLGYHDTYPEKTKGRYIKNWDGHPSDKGNKKIADDVAKYYKRILKNIDGYYAGDRNF